MKTTNHVPTHISPLLQQNPSSFFPPQLSPNSRSHTLQRNPRTPLPHRSGDDSMAEPKKRRRAAFATPDPGCEANQCIEISLGQDFVLSKFSSKEEAEAGTGFCVKPVDLNNFFDDEDGKIYGYQGLKITVLVSSISFHVYTNVTYESVSDGGKGITDLKTALQNMFGENIIEKEEFLQTFSTEGQYIWSIASSGERLYENASAVRSTDSCHSDAKALVTEVTCLNVGDPQVGHLYSRLVPLVLLLVDGSNPIDVTDSQWDLYLLVQKTINEGQVSEARLLGFAAVYRFYHYPDSSRLRLSQILISPPYQRQGYGICLLETITKVGVAENVYDFTIEEPLDSLQRVRDVIDVPRLLACESVKRAVDEAVLYLKEANLSKRTQLSELRPPLSASEEVRKSLKINKKQFSHCWEILIYLALDPVEKYLQNYKIFISDIVKANVLGKDSGTNGKRVTEVPSDYNEEMSFVMYKSQNGEGISIDVDGNQVNQEQQLQQLVDERLNEIKYIAHKVSEKKVTKE
ncbi:Histone acetyltransferase type B catalytic subunit-like protein [Drosera capensis]